MSEPALDTTAKLGDLYDNTGYVRQARRPLAPQARCLCHLTADSLVMAETAFPHGARGSPRKQEPSCLNCECLHELGTVESPEKDGDGTKQLIIKRQPFHHRLHRVWHDVDGKHLAAEEIFE